MSSNINIESLDNPFIQVVWEDSPENFTQEKIKSVKHYFQKKYQSTNVNIITRVKSENKGEQQTVDVSFNIMDKNYQAELVRNFLISKGYEADLDKIKELDTSVENKILAQDEDVTAFKKWYIKRIEFSNFLSYGENQVLDFEKCNGITVVESFPENFAGKTVISVDLLLFLFFNTTTKTTKAEEIFNRFSDKDRVLVRGEVTIDGEDYIIERKLERKKSKNDGYTVKSDLDFFKKLPNGELQNFTGEQRKETEKFIKNSIGQQEDFLTTILTTASNLEDLIDSKPTQRGQILSRFLGLEFLKRKEEIGKEFYSEFSKSMLSNVYNLEQLKEDIQNADNKISEYQEQITVAKSNILEIDSKLNKGKEYKEGLLSKKHTDIDHELIILNPNNISTEIHELDLEIRDLKSKINNFVIVEPSEYYHEDKHDEIKKSWNEKYREKVNYETQIKQIESLKNSVGNGIKCEHCGIELMNAAITQSKIAELDQLIIHYNEINDIMNDLSDKETKFTKLKKEFDQYEKDKLVKGRMEVTLESKELKLNKNQDILKRYNDVQEKIAINKNLEQQIIKANLRIAELENEKKHEENVLTTNNVLINTTREKISKNQDLIEKIKVEQQKERIYKIYAEVYGKNGISKNIMKTMMPLINSELQRLLEDSCYFKLEIRISDKNEVEFWMIDNSSGVEKLMMSGSGYERTIASLALRAVLSKICSLPKPNIIVMDEVFGKISNANLDMVGEFFMKIKEYFEKIILITHNPLVTNWADTLIRIEKPDNISKVIQ